MMTQQRNPIWAFLASVELALFLIFLLATTSIFGTLLVQNQPAAFYAQAFGPKIARFLQLLDLTDMYGSWWYGALLAALAVNLTVCSLDRIPRVLALLRQDGLATPPQRLQRMGIRHELSVEGSSVEDSLVQIEGLLRKQGWKAQHRASGQGILLFAQRGGWSRFGVYIVHLSILVIFAGGLVGSPILAHKLGHPAFAFKSGLMLPEGQETDHVIAHDTNARIDLGFTLRCDRFSISYYDNGTPKTYLSEVQVLEPGKEPRTSQITVNQPLRHKGITFYQSSFDPRPQYHISLRRMADDDSILASRLSTVRSAQKVQWPEQGLTYGILKVESSRKVARRIKLWLGPATGQPTSLWFAPHEPQIIQLGDARWAVEVRQLFATGLQVAKDPGVWLVYLGCLMMLAGLLVTFTLSHRRLYAWIEPEARGIRVLLAAQCNKNKPGLKKAFDQLLDGLPR